MGSGGGWGWYSAVRDACETKTEVVVFDRRDGVKEIRGRHDAGTADPIAAPALTRRAGCSSQVVPLKHVACLIKRTVETRATAKRANVSYVADGTIVVGLIGTATDRGARGRVALRGVRPVARIRAASLVVSSLVPLIFCWYSVCWSPVCVWIDGIGNYGIS